MLSNDVSPTCSHNMVNFGPLAAEICWRVWGTPANFNGLAGFLVFKYFMDYCNPSMFILSYVQHIFLDDEDLLIVSHGFIENSPQSAFALKGSQSSAADSFALKRLRRFTSVFTYLFAYLNLLIYLSSYNYKP